MQKDRNGIYKCKKCQYELKDVSNLSLSGIHEQLGLSIVKKHEFGRQTQYHSDDDMYGPSGEIDSYWGESESESEST